MGGLDWSGLPLMVVRFGVTDIEGLLIRLETLLTHRPPRESDDTNPNPDED